VVTGIHITRNLLNKLQFYNLLSVPLHTAIRVIGAIKDNYALLKD